MSDTTPEDSPGAYKALTLVVGFVVAGITAVVGLFGSAGRMDNSMLLPHVVGMVIGAVLIFPLLFAGLARVFARPFTGRKGWKAAFYGMVLVMLGQGTNFIGVAAKVAQGDPEVMPAASVEMQWQRFAPEDLGYAADFPGVPEVQETEVSVSAVLNKVNAAFSVVVTPLEPGIHPLETYETMEQVFQQKFPEAAIQADALFHDGVIGRKLAMQELPGNQELMLWLLVKHDVLYQVSANGTAPFEEELGMRFLSSFSFASAGATEPDAL